MTPQEIARKLSDFYTLHPDKWVRGYYGNLENGCCMVGGAACLTMGSFSPSTPGGLADVRSFIDLFERTTTTNIISYNDHLASGVNDIIAALNRVAAAP